MILPDYLFHYTNIETLALILKNKTIRFNSLDKMDDRQEQETSDIKNAGQFCYISSWTDDDCESIPMWKMYASLSQGVRIKLRANPFRVYINTAEELSKVTKTPVTDESGGKGLESFIPLTDIFSRGYLPLPFMGKSILNKVEYTGDNSKLYPKLLQEDGDHFSISMGELGKYKNLHWSFQNEWRYILQIYPIDLSIPVENVLTSVQLFANKLRQGVATQPFPYLDLSLSDEAFNDMEITLSPCISAGNRTIVQCLVDTYNSSATIKESTLLGLI